MSASGELIMDSFKESFIIAFNLILMGDSQLIEIVALSMKVSLIAPFCINHRYFARRFFDFYFSGARPNID